MTTTHDDLAAVADKAHLLASQATEVANTLGTLTADFPAPCPPPTTVEVPVQAAAIPDVRDLFDHGGEWQTRARWQAVMGRAPRRRSIWLAGGSESAQLTSMADTVTAIVGDNTGTEYVIGVNPFPGRSVTWTTALPTPTTHYERLAREAARIPLAKRGLVKWRFGWEFDGDWYPHSIYVKGQTAAPSPVREAAFITACAEFNRMFDSWCPGTVFVLNATGGELMHGDVVGRVLAAVKPDVFSLDFYPMWDLRTPARQLALLRAHTARAKAAGVPWAVDEWSPYVDKKATVQGVAGTQVGALDTPIAVEMTYQVVQFVIAQAAVGNAPKWVQVFDRLKLPEGVFSVVSVIPPAGVGGVVYDGTGKAQSVYAPRVAAMFVALLGRRP